MSPDPRSTDNRDRDDLTRTLLGELDEADQGLMAITAELGALIDERDAALRAAREELAQTNSELLQLTMDLNARIAERTEELRQHRHHLDELVKAHTAELVAANERLEAEVAERRRAEARVDALNDELRRRLAELDASNKELEAFVHSVSHDLRAPLRSIDALGRALVAHSGDRLGEQGQQHVARLRTATRRMGRLIDDLLALSRVGWREMEIETAHLSLLAREVVEELRASDPDHQVEWVIEEGLLAEGDASLLRVALANLLANAWKFTRRSAQARVVFGVAEKDGGPVYFVRDNGVGFDMAYAGRLFAAFQRLHSEAEFEGTGLGLTTVQRVVHRHGGRVWAESELGCGATFYFTLGGVEDEEGSGPQ